MIFVLQERIPLTLLPAGLLDLGGHADTDQTVAGLELLHGLGRVVDEREAGGLATTELGAETEDGDLVLGGLVQGAELLAELLLGDVGTARVEDVTVEGASRLATKIIPSLYDNFRPCPQKKRSPLALSVYSATMTCRH